MYFPIKFDSRKKSKSTRCFSFKYDSGEPVAAIRNDDFLNRPFNLQHKTMLAVLRKITLCKIHHILRCQLTQYCTVRCFRPLLKPISTEKHRMEFIVLDQRFFRKKTRPRNGENESMFLIQNHAFVDLLDLSSRVSTPSTL